MTAARIGIGGPVGSGKTALIEQLLGNFKKKSISVAVITNDLVTDEDALRIRKSGKLAEDRVVAVQAGACPHTVIREDPSLNISAADKLESKFPDLKAILIESGGDNLASTFSLDLVDWWMFVIDVAGGDDIPRKNGPGVLNCDLLVINKIDLAPYVGVNLEDMLLEAKSARHGRKVISSNCKTGIGVDELFSIIENEVIFE